MEILADFASRDLHNPQVTIARRDFSLASSALQDLPSGFTRIPESIGHTCPLFSIPKLEIELRLPASAWIVSERG